MWRVIKGWFLIGVERAEDPEVILTEAHEAMKRELGKARESAITAIAQRNQLRALLADQEEQYEERSLHAKAALKAGREDLAKQLLVERSSFDTTIESLKEQLASAEKSAEDAKSAIEQMELEVRQRAAEKLALIAGWKQAKIQEQLNKALSSVSMDSHVQAFDRAEERIREVRAHASARAEMGTTQLDTQLADMRRTLSEQKAEEELEKLKIEMGIAPAPVVVTETEADAALEELKTEMSESAAPAEEVQTQAGGDSGTPVRNIEV